MNKTRQYSLLIILFAFLHFTPTLYGQQPGEKDYGMYDRNIELDGQIFRVRRIPEVDFFTLRDRHEPGCRVEGIVGFNRIRELLRDEYTFIYEEFQRPHYSNQDSIVTVYLAHEIRGKEGSRIFLMEEEGNYENEFEYLPEFRILTFTAGHESDGAICLSTGKEADAPSSWSPDRKYCTTKMHDGQDSNVYKLKRWNRQSGTYETVVILRELIEKIPGQVIGDIAYLRDYFWVGDKFYFGTYYDKYGSVTMPEN